MLTSLIICLGIMFVLFAWWLLLWYEIWVEYVREDVVNHDESFWSFMHWWLVSEKVYVDEDENEI